MSVRDHRRGQWLSVNRDSRLSVGDRPLLPLCWAGGSACQAEREATPRHSDGQIKQRDDRGKIISSKCCRIACLLLFVFYQIRFLDEVFCFIFYRLRYSRSPHAKQCGDWGIRMSGRLCQSPAALHLPTYSSI